MKMMKRVLSFFFIVQASLCCFAQQTDGVQTVLLSRQTLDVGYAESTEVIQVRANNAYTAASDVDWMTVTAADKKATIAFSENPEIYRRTGTVVFTSADGSISRTVSVTQKGNESMRELTNAQVLADASRVFADRAWTKLKPEVGQADIDAMTNSFSRKLAQGLFDGTYDKTYRVSTFPCMLSTKTLAERWLCPGKSYDLFEGVTGIFVPASTSICVMVDGLPEGKTAQLKIVAWYIGLDGGSFDGGNPEVNTYTLKNGFNLINYSYEWGGLAYVTYEDDTDPEPYDPITVHVVDGVQNGILTPDKTNDEMYNICQNAKDLHIDCVGSKVHSVWTAEGLRTKCKTDRGVLKGYRQFLNMLDSVLQWEHDLLGFTKYNRIPKNHSFAYVNYTYFMFQGGLGVSFHHDQEVKILNVHNLLYTTDELWGISHEWGHQHQMHPYFCWAGTAEITNNLNSYYNIMRVGNVNSGFTRNWNVMLNYFLTHKGGVTKNIARHTKMIEKSAHWRFSPKMRALVESMTDDIPTYAADPMHSMCIWDFIKCDGNDPSQPADPILALTPFVKLLTWSYLDLGLKDIGPDFYESMRRISQEGGSDIEKPSGWDKYELIAMAQNHNAGGAYDKLAEQWPESCWVVDNYLNRGSVQAYYNTTPFILNYIRKWSRLVGYDLTPYFDAWGFFRTVAIHMQDYTPGSFIMTEEMINEFKADMQALVDDGTLKQLSDEQLNAILHCEPFNTNTRKTFTTPTIPN